MRNGNPSAKMNVIMRKIAHTEEIPQSSKSRAMVRSFKSCATDLRERAAVFDVIQITPFEKKGNMKVLKVVSRLLIRRRRRQSRH